MSQNTAAAPATTDTTVRDAFTWYEETTSLGDTRYVADLGTIRRIPARIEYTTGLLGWRNGNVGLSRWPSADGDGYDTRITVFVNTLDADLAEVMDEVSRELDQIFGIDLFGRMGLGPTTPEVAR
jgi:hypothetical protein